MKFADVVTQAIALLQRQGRVSYRALKRQFALDDQYLEDLKLELTEVLQVASDHAGTMLVWTGRSGPSALPAESFAPASGPSDAERRQRSEERRVGKECRSRWAP